MDLCLSIASPDRRRVPAQASAVFALALFAVTPFACCQDATAGLQLPASFKGELTCTDCAADRMQLDLWPDGVYHLKRTYRTRGSADDLGRWRRAADRKVILLYGGREVPLQFEVLGPRTLQPLGPDGRTAANERFQLVSDGKLVPAELTLRLHGMFAYQADAGLFEECLTGRSYPVAMEGDFIALERAYQLARKSPGAPLCERAMSHASFADQYWRVVSLRGERLSLVAGQREAHIVLHGRDGRYAGSIGCTRYSGTYGVEGRELTLAPPEPAVPIACAADTSGSGPAWYTVLAGVRRWSIGGQVMEWFDAQGQSVAVFEAVYLR